jgi:hypothetical protein
VITQVVERRYVVRVMDILEQAATVLALGDPNKQVELQLVLWILIHKDPELEYRVSSAVHGSGSGFRRRVWILLLKSEGQWSKFL